MDIKHCNDCGELVQYIGKDGEDYNTDRDGIIICSECGLQSRCFCDRCGEYVKTSECIVTDKTEYTEKQVWNICDAHLCSNKLTEGQQESDGMCDDCGGEYDSEEVSGIEITEVLCSQCQDEEE